MRPGFPETHRQEGSQGDTIATQPGPDPIMTETIATPLTERLGCRYPIISAGMGGPARAELAAAVSSAGGFGQLGMVRESPELITREIAAVKRLTNRPFAVTLIPACTAPQLL